MSVAVDVYAENAENAGGAKASGKDQDQKVAKTGPRRRTARASSVRAEAPTPTSLRADEVDRAGATALATSEPAGAPRPPGRKAARKTAGRAPEVRVTTLTDQELLEGLRSGSEWHFGELYHRYFQRIYNFVYARVRNHVESEEIVQETFIAVFRSFENYRGQSSLLSWIYGIAKNTTNNALRRAKTQNERIDLVDEGELLPSAALAVHSPDDLLDLHRFGEELSERLEQLADWQAEIFAMRHFENLSIPEISKRTRRSSDAVRSSLYRVKRLFFETALPGSGATLSAEDRG
ncbi:MAG: RNA polymerase sigma factor [Deltaproteobacteria bacterium]|nr:RNA polymerase sigma factor [Deltaproteobacteria bacterium]